MRKKRTNSAAPTLIRERTAPIGDLLRERRKFHGWTLAEMSAQTDLSQSTLSKIENGLMSPTYDKILQLCDGLGIDISDLLAPGTDARKQETVFLTRRSVSRQFAGTPHEGTNFSYSFLCPEVAHKRIVPVHVRISATDEEDMGEWFSHFGEEFITVLSGKIRMFFDFYEPIDLAPGDSVYLDSVMRHNFLSLDPAGSEVLVCHSSQTPNLAQTLRDVIKSRLSSDDDDT